VHGEAFEEHRPHLLAVAYRMLGSLAEADDAVQEAWLRMDRTDIGDVRNPRGWLTTVVARICLDMLRARSARPEEPLDEARAIAAPDAVDPEQEAVLADSIGVALVGIVVAPKGKLALVLRFNVAGDKITEIDIDADPRRLRRFSLAVLG
jgi:RNA polymerase sigma-70 factor (ECF subfamily)